jgi:lipopolysaccharide biosynthesis regulator YciM
MAYFLLGRIAAQQQDFALAIPRYQEAITHNGNVTGWYVDLALAQINNSQPEEARTTLRRALHRNGPNEQATELLKKINAKQARAKQASQAKAKAKAKAEGGGR